MAGSPMYVSTPCHHPGPLSVTTLITHLKEVEYDFYANLEQHRWQLAGASRKDEVWCFQEQDTTFSGTWDEYMFRINDNLPNIIKAYDFEGQEFTKVINGFIIQEDTVKFLPSYGQGNDEWCMGTSCIYVQYGHAHSFHRDAPSTLFYAKNHRVQANYHIYGYPVQQDQYDSYIQTIQDQEPVLYDKLFKKNSNEHLPSHTLSDPGLRLPKPSRKA